MPNSPATTAFDGLTYNSRRPDIAIPEYGRVVHDMVAHCITIEDREERSKYAAAIVERHAYPRARLQGNDRPRREAVGPSPRHVRVVPRHRCSLPAAGQAEEDPGPESLTYTQIGKRPSFYGRIVEDLIAKADGDAGREERAALAMMIANLLKRQYLTWNKGAVEDALIRAQLREMSGGALDVPAEKELVSSSEILKSKRKTSNNFRQHRGGKRKR